MRVRLFFILLVMHTGFLAQAKEQQFELSWVLMETGQHELSPLYFDELRDRLVVQREGEDQEYSAKQVISFYYGGYEYYSLPLNGSYSFFKVLHEGDQYAVLYKPAGYQLLDYFVDNSKGTIRLCEDATNPERLVLCEGSIGPGFGMPTYSGGSVQYDLQDAVFLAIGGQVHLVNCRYDAKGQWQAAGPSLQKKNKRTLKRLGEVVQDEQKMLSLKNYVISEKADLEDPEQMVKALQLVYN